MRSVFTVLVDFIYVQERQGGGTPQRIDLPASLFAQFQAEVRERSAEVGIDAIYPGAVLGVPVVESARQHARFTARDGSESPLPLTPPSA